MNTDHNTMSALLAGLLVGADQLIDSPDAWAARLPNGSPLGARFIEQLRSEWLPAAPPDALSESVRAAALVRVSAWHPGWPHLWAHILRVTGVAVMLAESAHCDPALVYQMGICHDVAKLDEFRTGQAHETMGAAFAREMLGGSHPAGTIDAVCDAILKVGDGPLTRILHDADKLDKIGAAGLLRRVSVETRLSWLDEALDRVEDDLAEFPSMHFDRSHHLAQSKTAFLVWFLPQARKVV